MWTVTQCSLIDFSVAVDNKCVKRNEMESLSSPETSKCSDPLNLSYQSCGYIHLDLGFAWQARGESKEGMYILRQNHFLHINTYAQIFKKFRASLPWRFNINLQSKLNFTLKQSFSFTDDANWSLNASTYLVAVNHAFDHLIQQGFSQE